MKKLLPFLLIIFLFTVLLGCVGRQINSTDTNSNEEKDEEPKSREQIMEEYHQGYLKNFGNYLNSKFDTMTFGKVQLNKKTVEFISDNEHLLPAEPEEDIKTIKEKALIIDRQELDQDPKKYFGKFLTFKGRVTIFYEEPPEEPRYKNMTFLYIKDENKGNFTIALEKYTRNIKEGDFVQFWGLLVSDYMIDYKETGKTHEYAFFGSHVEKVK